MNEKKFPLVRAKEILSRENAIIEICVYDGRDEYTIYFSGAEIALSARGEIF